MVEQYKVATHNPDLTEKIVQPLVKPLLAVVAEEAFLTRQKGKEKTEDREVVVEAHLILA